MKQQGKQKEDPQMLSKIYDWFTKGAFLAQAGEEAAERVLLQWAVDQYVAAVRQAKQEPAQEGMPRRER